MILRSVEVNIRSQRNRQVDFSVGAGRNIRGSVIVFGGLRLNPISFPIRIQLGQKPTSFETIIDVGNLEHKAVLINTKEGGFGRFYNATQIDIAIGIDIHSPNI